REPDDALRSTLARSRYRSHLSLAGALAGLRGARRLAREEAAARQVIQDQIEGDDAPALAPEVAIEDVYPAVAHGVECVPDRVVGPLVQGCAVRRVAEEDERLR